MAVISSNAAVGCMGYSLAAAFLVPWCAVTFAFDAISVYGIVRQCWVYTYAETPGTIVDRAVVGKKGSGLALTYRYVVDGRAYTNGRTRYSYEGAGFIAGSVDEDLPVGKELPVYYDPADPADAVLMRGPVAVDFCQLWFLIPFNVIGVGASLMILRHGRPLFAAADPRVLARTDAGWQYRPYGRRWWFYFSMALLAIAFLGGLGVMVLVVLLPVLVAMPVAFAAGFGLAAGIASRLAGRVVLEVDELNRTLTVFRRKADPLTVPLTAWKGFAVESETRHSDGDDVTGHFPAIRLANHPRPVRLGEYLERADAEAAARGLEDAIRASMASRPPG